MMIHPHEEEAFQTLDAAVFSSDSLEYDEYRERFRYFIERWQKALDKIEKTAGSEPEFSS